MMDEDRERYAEIGRKIAEYLRTPEGQAEMREAQEATRRRQEELRRQFDADQDYIRGMMTKRRRWWIGR